LLGFFILDWILWQIKGFELIRMNNETLTIKKKGKIFSIPEKLNLSQIKNIYLKEYKATTFTLFFKIMGTAGVFWVVFYRFFVRFLCFASKMLPKWKFWSSVFSLKMVIFGVFFP